MLVIADQGARTVGRQRRLSGPRKPEEDRAVAFRADICRGMHRQPLDRIGPGIKVLDEQLTALEVGQHALVQAVEPLRSDRLVDRAPPYRVLGAGFLDDVLVPRRASGKGAGGDRKAAAEGELA